MLAEGCSHRRSRQYFLESIIQPYAFPSLPCGSYQQFLQGSCGDCSSSNASCVYMGEYVSTRWTSCFWLEFFLWKFIRVQCWQDAWQAFNFCAIRNRIVSNSNYGPIDPLVINCVLCILFRCNCTVPPGRIIYGRVTPGHFHSSGWWNSVGDNHGVQHHLRHRLSWHRTGLRSFNKIPSVLVILGFVLFCTCRMDLWQSVLPAIFFFSFQTMIDAVCFFFVAMLPDVFSTRTIFFPSKYKIVEDVSAGVIIAFKNENDSPLYNRGHT